jgi:uncharacterized protein
VILVGQEVLSRLEKRNAAREEEKSSANGAPREENPPAADEEQPSEQEKAAARRAQLERRLFQNMAFPVFLGEFVTTLLAILTLRIFVGRYWPRVVALSRPSLTHLLLALIGLPAMLVLPNILHEFAKNIGVPSFENSKDMAEFFASWPLWFGVLVIGLGPGLSEELWCRAFLGRGLVGNYGPLAGVLLTSILFGLLHIDPAHAVAAGSIGLWLHFAYLMSRSLLVPMMLHTLNNSVAVFLSVVQVQLDAHEKHPEVSAPPNPYYVQIYEPFASVDNLASTHPWMLLAGSVALLSAVAWAMYESRARLVAPPDADAPWRPNFPGVELPPAGSATRVYRPWASWTAWALVVIGMIGFAGSIVLGLQAP